ncbi:cupin domain-containing protein [Psychrosphaera algicola]|uniref:Cupin domain-containing protein n=1 Tax=Psychrosphaera algicola TaxID=3023714 RepID=A0ABT5FAE9_9GAMM|nr:cupin domain-containing protein [Psychrosphaera sp. G1-22]MDC2887927.1 cupin domain-containing protein [Psychrosphaera sp. G1-22]
MDKYLVTKEEIDAYEGIDKTHFLNPNAKRINKSLGDLTGLSGIGFHIIEVKPGYVTTETHVHYSEEECVYVLEGNGEAIVGNEVYEIKAGDFIGYRAGGEAHNIKNTGTETLKCIVVGQRLDSDMADYPNLKNEYIAAMGKNGIWLILKISKNQRVVKSITIC